MFVSKREPGSFRYEALRGTEHWRCRFARPKDPRQTEGALFAGGVLFFVAGARLRGGGPQHPTPAAKSARCSRTSTWRSRGSSAPPRRPWISDFGRSLFLSRAIQCPVQPPLYNLQSSLPATVPLQSTHSPKSAPRRYHGGMAGGPPGREEGGHICFARSGLRTFARGSHGLLKEAHENGRDGSDSTIFISNILRFEDISCDLSRARCRRSTIDGDRIDVRCWRAPT